MKKISKTINNEVDLTELIFTIWDGKWKIAVVLIIGLISSYSYQLLTQKKVSNFSASTLISPINTLEEYKYLFLNSENLIIKNDLTITKRKLYYLYIEILNEKLVFQKAIRKFKLLDSNQYNSDTEYNEAIRMMASSIKIEANKKSNTNTLGLMSSPLPNLVFNNIKFSYHDAGKWKAALKYVNELTNKNVKETFEKKIQSILVILKEKQKQAIINSNIDIKNAILNYDLKMSDRILYLKEQSDLAKQLDIANPSEVQVFTSEIEYKEYSQSQETFSNLNTISPYYLRGYLAIDKEIELINLRTNKKAFVDNLFEIEKKKRKIEQSRTVDQIISTIDTSPLSDNKDFYAASLHIDETQFTYNIYNHNNFYLFTMILSLIIGISYVLISRTLQTSLILWKKRTN